MSTILNIRPLMSAVQVRLAELLSGITLPTKSGETVPVAIHLYRLPNASRADLADDLCPFAIITQLGGSDSLQQGLTRLRIIVGCYNEEEDGSGDEDLEEVAAAILRLSEDQDFKPHFLHDQINFIFGHPESGAQNHPEYYLTVDLTFGREPVYLNN